MFTVVKFNKTGQMLWLSNEATYSNKLCTFIGYVSVKGEIPK